MLGRVADMSDRAGDAVAALAFAVADTDTDPQRKIGSNVGFADGRRAGAIHDWLLAHGWAAVRGSEYGTTALP